MRHLATRLVLALPLAACGRCGSAPSAGDAAPAADAPAASAAAAALSLPIAAAATSDGAVVVAGLVAARRAVVAERREGARVVWTAEVKADVAWSPDLELRVLAGPAGGAVVLVRSSSVRAAFPVDAAGKVGAAEPAGGAICATSRGLVRVEGGRVVVRAWTGGDVAETAVPAERDAMLVCAESEAYALAEGEDDVVLLTVPQRGAPVTLVPDTDDERERAPFTFGDAFGVAEVGTSGAVRVVRVRGGKVTTTRARRVLSEGDDLEGVDGDEQATYLVLSRDADARCAGASGTDVVALRVGADGEREAEVAKIDCGKDADSFRVDATQGGALVAWAERTPKRSPTDPPVDAVVWAKLGEGAAQPVRVAVRGEGVAFAGCAKGRCHVVVLERPEGTDGMTPGTARVVSYP